MKGALLLALLAACSSGRPDFERQGDRAWHDSRWADAVTAYRAAGNSPRLLAKTADAALEGGMLIPSADAWSKLATAAPPRAGEAAAGLARVAAAAEHDGDQAALARAILALDSVAPGWPLGRMAMRLARMPELSPADAAGVVPAALASGPGRSAEDALLGALGHADRARAACDRAVPVLEDLLRRSAASGLRDSATVDLAGCELSLGLQTLGAGQPSDAERWLDRAARHDPDGWAGRRAMLAVGDARQSEGDPIAATNAWRSVMAHVPPDSLTELASERLVPAVPKVDSGHVEGRRQ